AIASVERLALLRTALDDVAFAAFGALHADQLLLHVLALGVVAAGGEFAEAAELHHQVVAAVPALLVERLIRLLLLLAELLRRLAIGVAGASEKRSEAALLQDHRTAAVVAVFLFALFAEIDLLRLGLPRVRAVGVAGAGDEFAVLAPLH